MEPFKTPAAPEPLHQVDVQVIEHELAKLWEHVSDGGNTTPASVRVCTLNLVACAPNRQAANHMSDVLRNLTGSHPNRAFLIVNEPDSDESRLETWVQANCQLPSPGAPQVCGEQISIHSYGSAVSQVAGLILSLLLPDLPVVLWWPGRAPFDSPLFNRLYHMIDRMIVDSATFANPDRDLVDIAAQLYPFPIRSPSGYAISDLNWLRLTPWRELIAQFFDTQTTSAYLYELDRVVIEYEHDPNQPPNRIQAMLMIGWLATCLSWTPHENTTLNDDGSIALSLRRSAPVSASDAVRVVSVELRPVPLVHQAHTLAAVRLYATDEQTASFVVEQTEEPDVLSTTVVTPGYDAATRMVRVPQSSDTHLLADELHLLSRDGILISTLNIAGTLTRILQEE